MGTVKNVEMNYFNGADYDVIRPSTNFELVSEWENYIYSKNEVDNLISTAKENHGDWEQVGFYEFQTGLIGSYLDVETIILDSTDVNYEYWAILNINIDFLAVSGSSKTPNRQLDIYLAGYNWIDYFDRSGNLNSKRNFNGDNLVINFRIGRFFEGQNSQTEWQTVILAGITLEGGDLRNQTINYGTLTFPFSYSVSGEYNGDNMRVNTHNLRIYKRKVANITL